MREFKFRAWENNKMYYQVRCGGVFDGIPTAPTVWNVEAGDWLNLTGQPHTKVMQYTGLKDKNGKEIYEGDIVTFEDAHYSISENGQEFGVFQNAGVIKWDCDYAQFYVTNRQSVDSESFFDYIGETEVIGNIYENPSLLEESHE